MIVSRHKYYLKKLDRSSKLHVGGMPGLAEELEQPDTSKQAQRTLFATATRIIGFAGSSNIVIRFSYTHNVSIN
jgi:hypothetical protein